MFTAVATRCFMLCNFQTTDYMNIFIGIYIILVGTIKQTNCLRVVLWNCTAGICFCVSNFIGAHFPCSVDVIIGIWYGIFQLGIVRVFWSHLYIYNIHMYLCIYVCVHLCMYIYIYEQICVAKLYFSCQLTYKWSPCKSRWILLHHTSHNRRGDNRFTVKFVFNFLTFFFRRTFR